MNAIGLFILGFIFIGFLLGIPENKIQKERSLRSFEEAHNDRKFEDECSGWIGFFYVIIYFLSILSAALVYLIFMGICRQEYLLFFAVPVIGFSLMDIRLAVIEYFFGITNVGGKAWRPYRLANPKKVAVTRLVIILGVNFLLFSIALILRLTSPSVPPTN